MLTARHPNCPIAFALLAATTAKSRLSQRETQVKLRVGVDLMGSESSPESFLDSVLEVLKNAKNSLRLLLFLDAGTLASLSTTALPPCIEFSLAETVISQEEDPLAAVRQKKKSSLITGLLALRDKKIDAFVTAGNTGALIAASALFLGSNSLLEIPVLMARVPSKKGFVAILDVGGNLACESRDLVAYAFAGSRYLQSRFGIDKPRVGLLNIGVEPKKGMAIHREAHKKLQKEENAFLFCGNVEGRAVFDGEVDLVVTDAFSGNIFLKTAEGMAAFLLECVEERLGGVNDSLKAHFDYGQYPGALVYGVEGIVIKCHGAAGKVAMERSILEAVECVARKV